MQRVLGMAIVAALGAACSGGATTSPHGTGPVVTAHADAGVAVAATPLTARECDDLIDHTVSVLGGSAATSAEIEHTAAGLKHDVGAQCATLPRSAYTCAMAATTATAVAACEP